MEMSSVCQSCGMPLSGDDVRGTEKNGETSGIYCIYCYMDGEFTVPELTEAEVIEKGGQILAEMYGMPAGKAKELVSEQVPLLKRWSGRIIPSCQSCGMTMKDESDFGTKKDGSVNRLYCHFCYSDGEFTEPGLTREGMIEKCAPMMAERFSVPEEKAGIMVENFISGLKRWND